MNWQQVFHPQASILKTMEAYWYKIELLRMAYLSRSVHEWGPPEDTAFLDYVFGPVFNSISKVGYQSIVDRILVCLLFRKG
ncbi:hypothetical protein CS542_01075 [Pedobacter sp. IW39]|nr:hypothetical protein CS542_01075 [Pedobacter sp. IW39]